MWTRHNHICRKIDTVCTRIKRVVALCFKENRSSTGMFMMGMEAYLV